jgi:molybdate/tungstate transport system substrate-binding protein
VKKVALALALVSLALLALLALRSREAAPATTRLSVLMATSLGPSFDVLRREFEAAHPGVTVAIEPGGSLLLARKLLDLGAPCDVIAVADAEVMDEVLIPGKRVASYRVLCGQRLGIVFSERSRFASEINGENWHEVLRRPGVNVGRADPDVAPAGYRTLLAFALAEKRLGIPGLARDLEQAAPARFVRGNLAALAGLLDSGEIDYAFDYESTAVTRKLRFQRLSPELDFSDPALAAHYAEVAVEVAGTKPGERRTVHGSPARYAVAIPAGAANPALAADFLALLASPGAASVLEAHGFIPVLSR